MFRLTLKTLSMSPKKTIFASLKALSCLVIVCALVFLPPSATHAASGMHDDQHKVSGHADHAVAKHAHDAASENSIHGVNKSASKADHEDEALGQCCSGLCVSVVLDEATVAFVERPQRDKYRTIHVQSESAESTCFLRPPLYLI